MRSADADQRRGDAGVDPLDPLVAVLRPGPAPVHVVDGPVGSVGGAPLRHLGVVARRDAGDDREVVVRSVVRPVVGDHVAEPGLRYRVGAEAVGDREGGGPADARQVLDEVRRRRRGDGALDPLAAVGALVVPLRRHGQTAHPRRDTCEPGAARPHDRLVGGRVVAGPLGGARAVVGGLGGGRADVDDGAAVGQLVELVAGDLVLGGGRGGIGQHEGERGDDAGDSHTDSTQEAHDGSVSVLEDVDVQSSRVVLKRRRRYGLQIITC